MRTLSPSFSSAILLAMLLAACGPTPGGDNDGGTNPDGGTRPDAGTDGGTQPDPLVFERLIDLGAECTNAGSLALEGTTLWVSCTGDFSGNGKLASVDLAAETVGLIDIGAAPGSITVSDGRIYAGNLLDGHVLVAGTDGTVIHGATDPVVLCPSDPANNVFQFVGDIEPTTGGLLATCFSTSEVKRFTVSTGTVEGEVRNATVSGSVTTGGGAQALAAWDATRTLVLDNLAAQAALITADGGGLSVETGFFATGDVPTDVDIRGDRAALSNSTSNTVQVVDLKTKTTVAEVNTGDSTNPWGVAWAGDDLVGGRLQLSNEVALVNVATNTVEARVALPEGQDLLPFTGMEAGIRARPQGVAVAESKVYVALTNLDEMTYAPAGHGLVAVLTLSP